MVSVDHGFVLDCLREDSAAIARWAALRKDRLPVHISVAARASVLANPGTATGPRRRRAEALLASMDCWDLDRMAIDCASMIVDRMSGAQGRLDGADLFVAACALRHGESLLSRNPLYRRVPGLEVETY